MHCVIPRYCASSFLHLSFLEDRTSSHNSNTEGKVWSAAVLSFATAALDCWDSFYMYELESSLQEITFIYTVHVYIHTDIYIIYMYIFYTNTVRKYLGLGFDGCPRLQQQKCRWASTCTELLSVHITLLKPSLRCSCPHWRCFTLFCWRINWQ